MNYRKLTKSQEEYLDNIDYEDVHKKKRKEYVANDSYGEEPRTLEE